MSVYKRKDSPFWQIRFEIAGHEVRRSSETTDKRAAQELEQKLRDDLWRQIKLGERRYTWNDAVKQCELEDSRQRSWPRKKQDIDVLSEYLDGELLSDITYEAILNLRSLLELRECKGNGWKTKRTWAPSTVNRTLAVLSGILNRCASKSWNMLAEAPVVPLLEIEKKEPEWAPKEKVAELLKVLPEHSADMALFACATGLRRSNVTHLEWIRVNLEARTAWVPASSAKGKQTIPIPLNDDAIAILRKWQGRHPRYVFCFRGRAPIYQVTTKAWRAACKQVGLPKGFTFHSLRHCWASWQVQSGTPLKVLQELGAWSSIEMPLRYAHLAPSHLAAYADRALVRTESVTVADSADETRVSPCSGGKGGTRTLDPSIMSSMFKKKTS
jgi:integrase